MVKKSCSIIFHHEENTERLLWIRKKHPGIVVEAGHLNNLFITCSCLFAGDTEVFQLTVAVHSACVVTITISKINIRGAKLFVFPLKVRVL